MEVKNALFGGTFLHGTQMKVMVVCDVFSKKLENHFQFTNRRRRKLPKKCKVHEYLLSNFRYFFNFSLFYDCSNFDHEIEFKKIFFELERQ